MINTLKILIKIDNMQEHIGNVIRKIEILRKHHKKILDIKNKEK